MAVCIGVCLACNIFGRLASDSGELRSVGTIFNFIAENIIFICSLPGQQVGVIIPGCIKRNNIYRECDIRSQVPFPESASEGGQSYFPGEGVKTISLTITPSGNPSLYDVHAIVADAAAVLSGTFCA